MRIDGKDPNKTELFKTVRVDPEISALLEQHNVAFKGEVESTFLRDLFSWIFPLILFVGVWYFLMKRMAGPADRFHDPRQKQGQDLHGERGQRHLQGRGRRGRGEAGTRGGHRFPERRPEDSRSSAARCRRAILLVGPPGTGKTLLGQGGGRESHVPFFSMSGSEFVEMFVGLGRRPGEGPLRTGQAEGALHHLHR